MFKTSNTQNTNQANSVYDSAGQRVATQVDNVWTFFIYDIGGKMVAEYGGVPAIDEGGIKYVLQDWQGSSRAVLSNTGNVQARMDYTAFGEEIQSGIGQRTTTQGFNAKNDLSQKYAQTERDKVTGLDHTWFRKNENKAGRWTSPDPYNGSASIGNPQSFNRYSYVGNDPANFVDPSGLNAASSMPSWWGYERWGAEWSGEDHFSWLSDGIVGYGGDFGGLLGGAPLLPGIHTAGYWSEGRWIMTGFVVVHSQSSSGGSVINSGGGGNTQAQTGNCGVNPVTGKPGINRKPYNGFGTLRDDPKGSGEHNAPRGGNLHVGIDISGILLQPIGSFLGGVVTFSGFIKGYGNTVEVTHSNGFVSKYHHLDSNFVKVKDKVEMGQTVGFLGQTGNAGGTNPHLDFEIFKDGKKQNPVSVLNSPCPK